MHPAFQEENLMLFKVLLFLVLMSILHDGIMRNFCVNTSYSREFIIFEPWHEISNNVVCATSKASDQPAHTRSLIRAFASRLSIQ